MTFGTTLVIVNTLHKSDKDNGDIHNNNNNNNNNNMYGMHHPTGNIDRLYLKRNEGGTEVLQTDPTYKAEIINTAQYLNTKYAKDQVVNIVKSHQAIKQYEFSN